MIAFNELAKLNAFSVKDVEKSANNIKTAYSLLDRLMKRGQVKKIRQNIYSCVNPATDQVVASPYHIACAVTNTAYISDENYYNSEWKLVVPENLFVLTDQSGEVYG